MDLICVHCGVLNEYKTVMKSNQLTAYCNCCGSYIKNIPHSIPALHFGKYKGRTIETMKEKDEVSYLHWLLKSEIKLSNPLKEEITKQLNIKP